MDGTWVYPMDDAEREGVDEELEARLAEAGHYLIVFLEPERCLALASSDVLGHDFKRGERTYHAMDEVVVFDWMTSSEGRVVGVRNLLPPERLVKAYNDARWPWISHEQDELRIWLGEERGAELSQTVHRCVFADPFRSDDGHLALAYDTYGLKPEEVERLKRFTANWVEVGASS